MNLRPAILNNSVNAETVEATCVVCGEDFEAVTVDGYNTEVNGSDEPICYGDWPDEDM